MQSPEPILDIITAAHVVFNQVFTLWTEVFTGTCDQCHGTGIITCRHCNGTKTLRRRPAQVVHRNEQRLLLDNPGDNYKCFYCGPETSYDYVPPQDIKDDEFEARIVQDNVLAVMSGAYLVPKRFPPTAGTALCPTCNGCPRVNRLTPNLERLFKLGDSLYAKAAKRISAGRQDGWALALQGQQRMEYPSAPPKLKRKQIAKLLRHPLPEFFYGQGISEKDTSSTFTGNEGLGVEDFVLNYIDEDEEGEEPWF